jgi:hypothetical protein
MVQSLIRYAWNYNDPVRTNHDTILKFHVVRYNLSDSVSGDHYLGITFAKTVSGDDNHRSLCGCGHNRCLSGIGERCSRTGKAQSEEKGQFGRYIHGIALFLPAIGFKNALPRKRKGGYNSL